MKGWVIAIILLFAQPLLAKEPRFNCEKKFGEMKWEGMLLHRYRLRAENFPPKQTFRLLIKSYNGVQTEMFRYLANDKGHLILLPPEDLEGTIYAVCPAKRGERLIFTMQSEEGDDAYEADIVPFPLEMKSKKGIRLSLELQGIQGETFLLFAQGFKPSEPIGVSLAVEEKNIDLIAKVTSLGDLYTLIQLPTSPSGGEAKLIIKRKNEEIAFPFRWGEPALEYVGACCFEMK